MLGHPYSAAIDMWSLGCVAAELFLGLPLFPGQCAYDLLLFIIEKLGYALLPLHYLRFLLSSITFIAVVGRKGWFVHVLFD